MKLVTALRMMQKNAKIPKSVIAEALKIAEESGKQKKHQRKNFSSKQ